MRKLWLVAAAAALVACKKDSTSAPAPARAGGGGSGAADPAAVAEVDALWKLAPKTATAGGVITGVALVQIDRALAEIRTLAGGVPGGDSIAGALEDFHASLLGTAATYADAGIALERGAAVFGSTTPGRPDAFVVVLPVSDPAKFVATHHGSHDGDVDHVDKLTCKPIDKVYACAVDATQLVLGGGDLGAHAGIRGVRGDAEGVVTIPALPPDAPLAVTGPLQIAIAIDRGDLVLRAHLPATLRGPLAAIAAAKPAKLAVDKAAGFAIVPLDAVGAAVPLDDAPPPMRELIQSIAGPLTAIAPAGVADVDIRVPMTSADMGQRILAACDRMGSDALPIAKAGDTCTIGPLPQVGAEGTMWLDGTTLRIAHARGTVAPGTDAGGATAIGRELAGYTVAFWGHGWVAPPTGAVEPVAQATYKVLGLLSELGLGARFGADGIDVLIAARTIHANPDAILADVTAAVASGDAAKVTAIAKAHPDAPFAADVAAGPTGMAVPTMVVGVLAGVAVPAFLEYMKSGKQSESDLALNRIAKSAKVYYIENGAFPTGDSGPTPKTSSCNAPNRVFHADPALWVDNPVWSQLEFMMEDDFRFQYRYQGTAKEFTATATADLDCDEAGVTTVTAHGTLDAAGNPTVEFQKSGVD